MERRRSTWQRMVVTLAAVLMTLGASRVAAADTLTLMWDPSPDPTVTGYVVYIGTQPGIYTQSVNVVSASFTFSTAVPGQLYCFAVSALAGIIEGPKSAEACGYSDRRPTLTNPGAQSSTAGQSDSLQLVGSDPDGLAVTYSATGLPPGLTLGTSTGFISGTPTTSGNHSVTATVSDGVLTASQTFSWNVAGGDTTAPTISITTPTSSTTYATSSATLNLAGTAADAVGVTQVSWVNDRGGSGTATGTTSWSVNGITLQSGANDITVTARDAANNTRTDSLTVTYTPSDATAPVVTITAPTTSATYTTGSASLTVSGTASDAVGVTLVSWSNSRGGSGNATGTTTWSASGITLLGGTNVITMTARDAAGNTSTDALTVTYNAPDSIAPVATITAPTSTTTYTTTASTLSVSGTASDAVGVTQVAWANNRGGSGTATGTTSWSISGITLQSGSNIITITAQDAAGNSGTDSLTVTYNVPDTTNPSVTISGPTSSATHAASATPMTVSGTASDNVGVTQVTWTNDRGGSGTASGTTTWTATSVALQSGANVITITARDAAGNTATDTLTVTYTPPDATNPAVAIDAPTPAATYTSSAATMSLGGTASDNVGVTQVTWTNNRGGSGTASGTTSWSASGITLQNGSNILTVTARDAAGNTATDVLTVAYTAPDTTAPVVSIAQPTSASTFSTTAATMNVSGTSSDAVGVTQVTWSNDRGGSGTATGTTSWSVNGVALQVGSNVITITARDAAGNTATDSLTITYAPPLTLSNVTANLTAPQLAGTPITFTATAANGTAPYSYKWWVFNGTTWSVLQNWSASNTYTWTPSVANSAFRVGVWVRNAGSTADTYDNPASNVSVAFPVSPAPTSLSVASLTANRTAPQVAGTPITFTAGVSGGTAPQQFKWMLFDGSTTSVVQGWSTSNTWTWTPATANAAYQVTVWARNPSSTADAAENANSSRSLSFAITPPAAGPLTLTGLTANLTAPQPVGTPITFTATISGGTAPHQFKWWVFDGGTWTVMQAWSTSNTWTWTPTSASGSARVAVWVRNAASTADAYDNPASNGSIGFAITGGGGQQPPSPLIVTSLTANRTAPQTVGTPVTFTATASGGATPYQYKWWVFNGIDWVVMQTWSASNTFTWTPSTSNAGYRVSVWVRYAGSSADAYDNNANPSISFPISPTPPSAPVLLTAINANVSSPQPAGASVTFTAVASGGSGNYQYKWWIFDGTSWSMATGWSGSSTFTWTPGAPGSNYRVGLWIRNASSTIDAYDNPASNGSIGFVIQ